jgi:hypothetical protein
MQSVKENKMKNIDKKEVFEYLDELKDIHQINMFGAGSYLRERYNLTKRESYELLNEYMHKGE